MGLNDFRTISLVGCMYKIVSKILASRLKIKLSKLIDVNQFAFLGGRNMLDSVLIVNEIISEAKNKKIPSLVFKVDYEKAYDSVQWDFLLCMLQRMNFCNKWVTWIKGSLESNSVSVLVNGSPTQEFKMWKGLRQGDPIAPFLFLIVAEGLNGLLKNAMEFNKFTGFKVGRQGEVVISMVQFADDTLFLGDATTQNVVTLKCILRCFELVYVGIEKGISDWFDTKIYRTVGEGNAAKFWSEAWFNQEKLLIKFPRLYNITIQRDCCIREVGFWLNGIWNWDLKWRRDLREFEAAQFDVLIDYLRWAWKATPEGFFTVHSAYCLLQGPRSLDPNDVFKQLWSSRAPPNAVSFAWRIILDKLQTKSNLLIRHVLHSAEETLSGATSFNMCTGAGLKINEGAHGQFGSRLYGQYGP
ncbi:uncharacterized protein LOC130740150 [Lotus japonicus]|uniref:uncharacterized protein LOC130740150 n=1 Tax=Lotus japonicus TaxID=34305 RepID=UPI00258A0EAD|nr:uncharacterized protein LOC130740150 [Lotus japonicus]